MESLVKNCPLRPVKGAQSARKLLVERDMHRRGRAVCTNVNALAELIHQRLKAHQLTLVVYQALKRCVRKMDPSTPYHLVASLAERQS